MVMTDYRLNLEDRMGNGMSLVEARIGVHLELNFISTSNVLNSINFGKKYPSKKALCRKSDSSSSPAFPSYISGVHHFG